ncbi:hypothetical protein FRB94_009803 [Tulasnella sp. JGI-2019a]|nr:hypothetical protein FRB94_009803 [Tulasnella sp. JGI-2019a]
MRSQNDRSPPERLARALKLLLRELRDDPQRGNDKDGLASPEIEIDRIYRLLTLLSTVDAEVALKTRTLQIRLASLSGINKLPAELLIKIFHCTGGIDSSPDPRNHGLLDFSNVPWRPGYAVRLNTLSQVCRTWREIARYPELWTHLNDESWKTALVVSQSLPLTVDWDQGDDFGASALRVAGRWRSARVTLRVAQERRGLLLVLEKASVPILKNFGLLRNLDNEELSSVNLFNGHAPMLETLTLEGIKLRDWSSPMLSGLRGLILRWFQGATCLTITEVLEILHGCLLLEQFVLEWVCTSDATVQDHTYQVIELPRLQGLRMKNRHHLSRPPRTPRDAAHSRSLRNSTHGLRPFSNSHFSLSSPIRQSVCTPPTPPDPQLLSCHTGMPSRLRSRSQHSRTMEHHPSHP